MRRSLTRVRWSLASAAALGASGLAGVLIPDDVGGALELRPTTPRGRPEVRAGLGGTFAALGAWALTDRSPAASRPRTDAAFWSYLVIELGLGSLALRDASAVTAGG